MKNNINLIIQDKTPKERVDQFLAKKYSELSRTRIKNTIIDKNLKIKGKFIFDPSKKISPGDNLIFTIPEPKKTLIKPYDFKLNIVFEDKYLLVINKPAGISMHPGAGDYDKTLVNALVSYDKKNLSNINGETRPGIVHRIDKDTSGLVVIANHNSPKQIVVSGTSDAIIETIEKAKNKGARLALELKVSGAFHSPLMNPAKDALAKILDTINFKDPQYPVFNNVNCKPIISSNKIKNSLIEQLEKPVLWTKSIIEMKNFGVESFLEVDVFQLDIRNPVSLIAGRKFQLQPKDIIFIPPSEIVKWNRTISLLLPQTDLFNSYNPIIQDGVKGGSNTNLTE